MYFSLLSFIIYIYLQLYVGFQSKNNLKISFFIQLVIKQEEYTRRAIDRLQETDTS